MVSTSSGGAAKMHWKTFLPVQFVEEPRRRSRLQYSVRYAGLVSVTSCLTQPSCLTIALRSADRSGANGSGLT
jgi:hypothetical protein